MLYYFFSHFEKLYHIPGFGAIQYITVRAGAAAVTALLIAFWVGPKLIRKLKERQIGESAKLEAPKTHLSRFVSSGDLVLVKGSRGMKMEDVVSVLQEKFAQD